MIVGEARGAVANLGVHELEDCNGQLAQDFFQDIYLQAWKRTPLEIRAERTSSQLHQGADT